MSPDLDAPPPVQVAQPAAQVAIDLAALRVRESIGSLRDHFDALLLERDQRYGERFDASQTALKAALEAAEKLNSEALSSAERAVLKAEAAAERRFESINEFRQTLSDQAASMITRNEVQARFDALAAKIEAGLESAGKELASGLSRIDRMDGKSGGIGSVGAALASGLSIVIALAAMIISLFPPPFGQ